jgi:capsular exopolysaccharide synthesis family protein
MADFGPGHGRDGARSSADSQSLVSYFEILRERVWLILACTLLVLGAAVAYVELAPRQYQAQAELDVQAAASNDAVLSALPVLHQTGAPTEDVLTGASLVTTTTVAGAVASALHLKASPGALLGDISANPIGQASLVAVQATASSPLLAQRLANAFVQQTIATTTAAMHAAINSELPTLKSQILTIPLAQRYGPGSQGDQILELEQLDLQSNPTLTSAASAVLPTSPSSPKRKLTLIAGLFAGLMLGVGAAFAFHAFDPRLRREEQLREIFGLPILARIPRERLVRRSGPLLPSELDVAANEGYRTLRTMLAGRGPSSEPRVYLVTGSSPSDGKSTTAISLAAAQAQSGGTPILIEADLRRPTFASVFDLKSFPGIEQVMMGKLELVDALAPVRVGDTSIRVLAAHRWGAELADRLSPSVVRKLIDDAKALSDFVVIDSPPLNAVIDALPFAQLADEVLIVARLEHSRLNKLEELNELLSQHAAHGSGLVLVGGDRPALYYYGSGDKAPSRSRGRSARALGAAG